MENVAQMHSLLQAQTHVFDLMLKNTPIEQVLSELIKAFSIQGEIVLEIQDGLPIQSSKGEIIGTLRIQGEKDEYIIKFIQKTAAILIERYLDKKKFSETIEKMGDGFFQINKDWIITKINNTVAINTAKDSSQIVGKNFWDVYSAINNPETNYYKAYHKVMNERIPVSFVDHYEPTDLWTEVDAYPEQDGGMSVYYRDISITKQAEHKTRLNEERLRTTFRYSYIGINLFDLNGKFLDANPAFCAMTGFTLAELLEMKKSDITHPDDLPESRNQFELLVSGATPFYKIEKRYLKKDGSWFWAQTTLSTTKTLEGKINSVVALTEDITIRKRLEKEVHNERENFRNLFRQTPEMVCILEGPNHRFEFVNEAHVKALGFDATGMEVREAQPESKEIHGILDNVYQTGKTAFLNEIAVTLGKNLRYFDLTYAARKNDLGEINGVMILGTEITDIVKSRNALAESEAKFKTIANAMPQMLWSTLPDGYHDYYNQRWYDFTGVPQGSTDGEGWNDMFHPDDQNRARELWSHSLKTGDSYEIEYRLKHHKLGYRWVLGRALPIRDAQGNIIRWMGTCTDIEDQKIDQENLKRAVSARTEFLSIASHELRTPLTSLRLQTQSMRRNFDKGREDAYSPERVSKLIELNERQLGKLGRLVDDMLDFSRIESGKLTYRKVPANLSQALSDVYEVLREQLENAHCETTVDFTPNIKGVFDVPRIEQVLTNLVTNAMRYGKVKPVRITLQKEGSVAILTVKDNGSGIEYADQKKIFKRFERLVNASEVSGLGLGLYITKEIVDAHGGEIEVKSKVGEGAQFIVRLPCEV